MNVKTISGNNLIKSEVSRLQKLDIHSFDDLIISDFLTKSCISSKRFIFNKKDVNNILGLTTNQIDYVIKKHDLCISKCSNSSRSFQKIIKYSDFIQHFATPYILKNLNLAEKEN